MSKAENAKISRVELIIGINISLKRLLFGPMGLLFAIPAQHDILLSLFFSVKYDHFRPEITKLVLAREPCTNLYTCTIEATVWDGNALPSFVSTAKFSLYRGVTDNADGSQSNDSCLGGRGLTVNKPISDGHNPTLMFNETATISYVPDLYSQRSGGKYGLVPQNLKWTIPNQDTIKFSGRTTPKNDGSWEGDDNGWSVPITTLDNAGTVEVLCSFDYFYWERTTLDYEPATESKTLSMTITVINDMTTAKRYRIECPAVGNPLSTPQLFLESNCGNPIYQNSMVNPIGFTNSMVSATIQNSFSAGYVIQASGDAQVKTATSNLSNLSFRLVDGNFVPIKLLNPMYITLSVTPVPEDPNELNGMTLPKYAPTSEQKAIMDRQAEEQRQAEAIAKAKQEANTNNMNSAYQLWVQYLQPLVQQQQAIALQQQQQQQIEQNKLALLQDPEVLSELGEMPEEKQPSYLEMLAQQMLRQQLQEQQQKEQEEAMAEEEEQQVEAPQEPEIAPVMWDADNVDKDF
jgi:hypothetical protein